jgi:glucokinase
VAHVLAVDIGGSHLRVGLFDQAGRCLKVTEDDAQPAEAPAWVLDQVRAHYSACLQESAEPITACGVSWEGLVDFERQLATSIHHAGWERFPLADRLRQDLGIPCKVDSDVNAAALGELRFGAGRGTDSLAFVMLSSWLRCSLVCRGQLWRGKDSLAGELGHVPVSESGAVCSCGARGCLELFCSGTAIAREAREYGSRRPEALAPLLERSGGRVDGITARAVAEAAAQGDSVAVHIMGEAAGWLARALLTIIRIVNPEKIILGGGVAQAGPVLMEPLRDALKAWDSPAIHQTTEIVSAELGALSSLCGAAVLALDLSGEHSSITT